MAILLELAIVILGGFARPIAEYSFKTPQSNEEEWYKYLASEASDRALVRLKCYRSINLLIMHFTN